MSLNLIVSFSRSYGLKPSPTIHLLRPNSHYTEDPDVNEIASSEKSPAFDEVDLQHILPHSSCPVERQRIFDLRLRKLVRTPSSVLHAQPPNPFLVA